ncbi:hypothetical protein Q9L58_002996 [Maublancomyces gigas]|uniref:Uncharacterized protein n=1 Tax=Discina gigas TaxID=1032678 RepID=A0ABR3GQ55_9PEZI
MPFLYLPNEILLFIAAYLEPRARYLKPCDLYHLILTNRRLANLLLPQLNVIACYNQDTSKEALYRAAAARNEENVRHFLENGRFFEVRQRNVSGDWPWVVIWNTRPKERVPGPCPNNVVEAVMRQGAGLVLDWVGVEHSALHWGVSRGDTGLVRHLLDQGAGVDFEYTKDWPPEVWGCALPMGTPFKWDSGPLHKAAHLGDSEMVLLLLERGIGVNTQDQLGRTALDAGIDGWHESVVQLLLGKGADINLPNRLGYNTFHEALKTGNNSIVELLIENGADVHAVGNNGQTALHLAAENEHEVMLLLLLKQGIDVSVKDNNGNTALHIAAGRGQVDCVCALLCFGADAQLVNDKEQAPLELAEGFENEAEISYFLNRSLSCAGQIFNRVL